MTTILFEFLRSCGFRTGTPSITAVRMCFQIKPVRKKSQRYTYKWVLRGDNERPTFVLVFHRILN